MIGIYFIRISRLKFEKKKKEYFKNKPEAEMWKRIQLCLVQICIQYNDMFLTKPYKNLPFP